MFGKKKKMIDVRELQRRGVVRLPKKDIVVPTNRDGFVEFGTNGKPKTTNQELFNFPETNQSRAESSRITELDNKIYKLEQRIELLEKKAGIEQPSTTPNLGVMGW